MAKAAITFRIAVAWWLRPYLYGVALTAWLTGLEPDMNKVGRMVRRGIRIKAI